MTDLLWVVVLDSEPCVIGPFDTFEQANRYKQSNPERDNMRTMQIVRPARLASDPDIDYVVVEVDPDGPSEAKAAQWDEHRRYVVLQMVGYRRGEALPFNSIGDIDFFDDGGDWMMGAFDHVLDIPEWCPHLRALARDLGLKD